MATSINKFRMPRYSEIPNVGLFLEQTVKYINGYLEPLGCMNITASMVSNYVKKGYISSPIKKQYYSDQIAYLFFIAIAKNVLSMDNIELLFRMQRETYTNQHAYDYFCNTLENSLFYIFEHDQSIIFDDENMNQQKKMLQSVVISAAHIIYLSNCFDKLKDVNN